MRLRTLFGALVRAIPLLLFFCSPALWAQPDLLPPSPPLITHPAPAEPAQRNGPVAALYRALRTTGLDANRVFHVREATLDRGELHLYLTDGTLAFSQDVEGHVTAAYFEGEGEVLMRPPDLTEHASLGLFSGLGVLDEHFSAAYLRFNDPLMEELKPYLREMAPNQEGTGEEEGETQDTPQAFVARNAAKSAELAEVDALRLLETFTAADSLRLGDHFLHARLATRLGNLDVYDDSRAEDQFMVARLTRAADGVYLDVWMAFPGAEARRQGASRIVEPAHSASAVPVDDFEIETTLAPPEVLDASASLDVHVATGGQRLLTFELSRWLRVSSVSVDGNPVEFLQNEALNGSELKRVGNDLVTVVMPAALRPGERHHLVFRYAGPVMQQVAPGLLSLGARGTWYPNRGMQMSRFQLRFRWPRDWTLVATGVRGPVREEGEQREAEWSIAEKVPLAGFNLGKFMRATSRGIPRETSRAKPEVNGVEVASYATDVVEASLAKARTASEANIASRNEAIARRSAEAIGKYAQWFGPYPYQTLALTQMPGAISQSWPTLVYLSSIAYLSDEERQALTLDPLQQLAYAGFMQDHETAHQWWGNQVGWKSYRDQWLMEALANLSALMLMEEQNPQQAREVLEQYRQQLLQSNAQGRRLEEAGPVTLGYRLSSSVFPNAYIPVTYGRGLWLLVMLRDYFADYSRQGKKDSTPEPFLAALREFAHRYAEGTPSTADFQKVLEEFLPPQAKYEGRRSLDWFFREWVGGNAVPEIELRQGSLRRRADSTEASFDILQKQCPDSLVTSVPLYAELRGGKRIYLQRVFADGHESHFTMKVPAGTKRLLLDPERKLLRRN